MTAIEKLKSKIKENKTFLCAGLDVDIDKLPAHMDRKIDNIFEFNKSIINATKDFVCSYKINFAFYEQYGIEGYELLKETFDLIPDDIFTVADAKRGDIGNTSRAYAISCFEYFGADSVTVSPYMGEDSIKPFLEFDNKMVFILGLTSNKGSADFQKLKSDEKMIYEHIIEKSSTWASKEKIGYVTGATHPAELGEIRKIIPENPLLIPGIGAQGGDLAAVLNAVKGTTVLINVSRGLIYASGDKNYAQISQKVAENYKYMMKDYV
jgi:orotidine-5'-phosphate decarboxylase